MQQTAGSFRARAVLALSLLIGFYTLAFVIVAALGFFIYLSVTEGRIRFYTLTAALAILAILRGVFFVDRSDPEPVGIPIDDSSQPRLMALVKDVASAANANPPDAVYLVPDVNAFVYEDGKLMGLIKTKRIMGIGLGLLNVLHVDELKAVLAHEYGHFAGGDTRLSGIVYRTRSAIGRTVEHLAKSGTWLARIFDWYGRLFLRLTQRMSRQQELDADGLAAGIGGRDAQTQALEKTGQTGPAFNWLIDDYVAPLWHANKRPANFYSGFRQLLQDPTRQEQLRNLAESSRDFEDPYDSHPSLERRIDHLKELPPGPPPQPTPARDLLSDPERTEQQMTEVVSARALGNGAAPVADWDAVAPAVVDVVKERADAFREVGAQRGAQDLMGVLGLVREKGAREAGRSMIRLDRYPREMQDMVAQGTLGEMIYTLAADILLRRPGFKPKMSWAGPLDIESPDGTVVPLDEWAERVAAGEESPDEFTARLEDLVATTGYSTSDSSRVGNPRGE
ncbi:MAG: M48 family metalloprotease [Actinobacteria bacterium]|nr:M48 family metalloprotease [Actinomycetota bacterium]